MEEKAVAEYAGISIFDVMGLDIFLYWMLLHDLIVYNHSQTKQGREWLRNAHRLTQTEPDLDALRQHFGKGGG